MKKITFLLVAMLAFCWQGHAQFTENFESGVPGAFTETQDAEAIAWGACSGSLGGQTCPINGSTSATFYRASYTSAVTSLTTPIMDLSAGGFRLKFVHSQLDWGGDQNTLLVEISIDGGGTWTTIEDFTTSIASPTSELYLLDTYTTTAATQIRFTGTTNYGYAVVLDDVVVEPIPTCTPAVVDSSTVVDDCGNSQFSVDVVVSTVGDGTSITDGLGGSFPVVAGTVTAGPYTNGDTVTLTVEHSDGACNFSLGDFSTGCTLPGEVCENSIIVASLPYSTTDDTSNYGDDYSGSPGASGCGTTSSYLNGDDVVYSYTATADTSINVSMTPTASWSGIFVYTDCADIGVNCVAGSANSGTSERNFDLTVTNGTTYYFVISTFASPQSTGYTLNITENTCTAVTATFDVINDCDTSGGFYVEVDVTDMGSATALTVSDDQGNPSQPLTSIGTLQFGPYVNGTDVVITIDDDNDDDSCTVTSSAITQSVCPPANDECADAIALTVNPDYGCGTVTSGTVAGATNSGVNVCGGTEDDDVWYSFVATATEHRVSLVNIAGSTIDMYHAVYDATPGCGALTAAVICSDANTSNLTGLTIGNTYYVQVYTWTSTGGQTSTFDICVGTPPTCYDPSNLSAAFVAPNSADLSWDAPTQGTAPTAYNWEVVPAGNGQGNGIVDSGSAAGLTATATGLTADTLYDFYVQSDCGGGDTSSWAGPFTFNAGYCIPTGTSSSTYIDNFTTTGAAGVNIDNSASGFATGNYGDYYSTHYVELASDQNFDFSVGIVGGTVGAAIWIDWNNDFVFDLSEVVYSTTGYGSGPFTGTITVPNGTANGDYRMRVLIDWNDSNPGDDDACSFGSGRGEVEDYKITVDNSLSVANLEISQFTYFPNPVNNTLSLRGVKDIQNVAVYNMLGQEVLRTVPNSVNSDVDMSGLQSGTYFVKVMIENTTKTIKVIKK